MCLPSNGRINKGSSSLYIKQSDKIENQDQSNKRCIHLITLSNPLVVKNYLPVTVSLTIESGGVTRDVLLSEVGSLYGFFNCLLSLFYSYLFVFILTSAG